MKKLWILNHYALGPTDSGGTRHYDLAKEIVDKGYDVTIFASAFLHFGFIEKEKNNETINGVKFVWIKTFHYFRNDWRRVINMISYFVQMLRTYSKHPKPDIIIASSPHLLTYIAGLLIAKKIKVPLCIEIRDLWPQTMVDMGILSKTSPITKVLYFIERYIYKKSDKIITLLPGFNKYLEERGVNSSKVRWIPNGINFEYYTKSKTVEIQHYVLEQLQRIKGSQNCLVGMYMGAMGLANGLVNIIHAAEILWSRGVKVNIILVGRGSEREALRDLVCKKQLKNIFIFDEIPKDIIYKLYDYVDFNIFNLQKIDILKYGLSANKLFDYLYSAKPTIFACNALNDPIKDSLSGISIPPEDPVALADAVEELSTMTKLQREEMGQNGRKYAILNHDIKNNANKLEEVVNELCSTNINKHGDRLL